MKQRLSTNTIRMPSSLPSKNKGLALLTTVLALMIIVSLLTLTTFNTTILETKMVFNIQDKQRSFAAADSAALYAWEEVNSGFDITEVINNDTHPGYYVLGSEITSTSKRSSDWNAIESVMSWPWEDNTKHFTLPDQLGGDANPMKLVSNPQYTIGIHNPVLRKGTANHYCNPISIIGASQGGTTQTRTLVEMKTIPTNSCYYDEIK